MTKTLTIAAQLAAVNVLIEELGDELELLNCNIDVRKGIVRKAVAAGSVPDARRAWEEALEDAATAPSSQREDAEARLAAATARLEAAKIAARNLAEFDSVKIYFDVTGATLRKAEKAAANELLAALEQEAALYAAEWNEERRAEEAWERAQAEKAARPNNIRREINSLREQATRTGAPVRKIGRQIAELETELRGLNRKPEALAAK